MTPERWQQIKHVLDESLALRPSERPDFLAKACAGEPELLSEVQSLINSYEQSGNMLDTPALEQGAVALAEHLEGTVIGRKIGVYELVEEIGRGGMGTVYRAQRTGEFRQQVAIKVVKRGFDSEFIVRRFRNERQIMAALEHPNIARLLDGGTTSEGLPYFVMEFIAGKPIDEYCDTNRLGTLERLNLFRTVCLAVAYAHKKRVVHRDIKPGNILITAEGEPKLLDFGIAKIFSPDLIDGTEDPTLTMMRLMTPEYASPEQVRGEPVTVSSDVYSLGVVLYELLTGHRPYRFRSRAPHDLARAVCEAEPERPSTAVLRTERLSRSGAPEPEVISPTSVSRARATDPHRLRRSLSGDIDNIILMAMRKEPERRYASVEQLSEDIRRHIEGRPVTARKDTIGYRGSKFFERHRAMIISALIVFVLFITGVLYTRRSARSEAALPRVVPLTSFPGDENQPAFSPDGKKIAFVWNGENNDNQDVYVKDLEGGRLLRLTTNPAPDVSPAWSPDGRFIAFLRTSKTETAVFVSPASGGVQNKVADLFPARLDAAGIEAFVHPLAWSPDGARLAIGDRTAVEEPFSIHLLGIRNNERRKLTLPPERTIGDTNPAFSPDGSQVSFVRAPSSGVNDLWVTSVEGGVPRRLTFDNRDILSQTWTPDGRYLVFASNRTGSYSLWRVRVSGGTAERIQGITLGAADPSFSPDGRRMAFSQFFLDTNVWRIDREHPSSPPRMLIASTVADSSPQYSPDGTRIAFRSSRSGSHEIWLCNSEGKQSVQLTNFAGPLTGTPRWSPDGRFIAFDTRPEGQADIWIAGADGGKPRRLTTEPSEDVVPSWSRDGKSIYYASNRSGAWQVWRKPVDGGNAEQVTFLGGFAAFESPDGKYLYYAKGRSVPGLWRKALKSGIEELALDELRPGFWGYWAIVNDGVYFFDDAGAEGRGVYFSDLKTHRIKLIEAVEKKPMVGDSAFAVSPDGRYILYTQVDQSGSDIMIAEYPE